MAKITIFPLGNADGTLIEFSDRRLLLKDYFCPDPETREADDKRAILSEELDNILKEKNQHFIDVVCFSHSDNDHIEGAEKYFKMDHAPGKKDYGSVEIKELWVPSYFIIETKLETESARIIQKEARYRLEKGEKIKVFGRSDELKKWIDKYIRGNRDSLIATSGTCVNGFSQEYGQVEIFIHSPFSAETDAENPDRNEASIILHVTFFEGGGTTKLVLGSDATSDIWDKIIKITEGAGNSQRLEWDIFRISHHCSYKALNMEEKGKEITTPTQNIKRMFEKGDSSSYLVSSSEIVPDEDTDQPPHKQAKAYYKSLKGDFIVTMEEPSEKNPKPIVFNISSFGHSWSKITGIATGISSVTSQKSQRQG